MSIKNRDLFEKARSAKFEPDASLLSFILERKNLQVQDDVDSLSIDLLVVPTFKVNMLASISMPTAL